MQVTGFSNDNVAFSYGAKRHSKKHGKIGKKHCKPAISISFFQVEARLCAALRKLQLVKRNSSAYADADLMISSKCLHGSSIVSSSVSSVTGSLDLSNVSSRACSKAETICCGKQPIRPN